MPSYALLSAAASIALAGLTAARPIPHTVTLFRRAILDAKDGVLIVQNEDAPKTYSANLEPYDQYHFRYMAIGCGDVDQHMQFFETCCQPRSAFKIDDSLYPSACQLSSYSVFMPDYQLNQVVAKLGSVVSYEDKLGYSNQDSSAPEVSQGDVASPASSSSSSTWTSSSTPAWTPSSSSSAPAWTPSSSSSEPAWTPSSSSSTWTPSTTWSSSEPAWTPSSSSSTWTPSSSWSSSSENTWTPPASSSSQSVWHAAGVQAKQVVPSSSWTPSPSPEWTPESSSQAPAPSSSANNNGGSGDFTGTASWFTQNGNPGACGVYNSDSANIVAIKTDLYGWTGQKSQYCGRSLTITNTATGATAQATVADACPGCSSYYSLDLSTGLFQQLGSLDQGLLPIKWHWN